MHISGRRSKVSSSGFRKLGASLVTCSIALSLLLGSITAQAARVILEGTKVIRIENLEVFDDQGGPMTYDVDFVYDRGVDVYGSNFAFDFRDEEEALSALIAVVEELNRTNPRPDKAGPAGKDQFFIGVEVENQSFIAAVGGEFIGGVWNECERDCVAGTAVLKATVTATWADFSPAGSTPPPSTGVDLTGTVENSDGTGLCAMVLASGQYEFSCNPNGPFSLTDLPTEGDGTVKRQVYVDGFFPNVEVLPGSVDETVVMERAGTCPNYNAPYNPDVSPGDAGKRVNSSGRVLLQDTGTPVCAMVLANGQYQFSCDGTGNYKLNVPLDDDGQFKLQVYADGFAPITQRYDDASLTNNVRLARSAECN